MKEIDLSTFPLERKLSYSQKVDLLSPFWVSNFALLQPWPEEEGRLTIPICTTFQSKRKLFELKIKIITS